jgi:hypothetical protein
VFNLNHFEIWRTNTEPPERYSCSGIHETFCITEISRVPWMSTCPNKHQLFPFHIFHFQCYCSGTRGAFCVTRVGEVCLPAPASNSCCLCKYWNVCLWESHQRVHDYTIILKKTYAGNSAADCKVATDQLTH